MKRRKMMETSQKLEKNPNELIPKKQKQKYNLTFTGFRQKVEQNLDDNQNLINKLTKEILSQGPNVLFDIEKTLMKLDLDRTGYIDFDQFSRLLYEYNVNLIPNEIKTVYACFDPSRSGRLFYKDFLNIIHGDLNDNRLNTVNDLYTELTKNKYPLDIKTVLGYFNLPEEYSEKFKDNFLSHHEFFDKNPGSEVSYDEFVEFFENLGIAFPEDEKFAEFLNGGGVEQKEENDNREFAQEFLDDLDNLRNILISQGSKGVINLLKNIRNADLSNSNEIDLDEFFTVIQNLLKDSNANFPMKEIRNIFDIYDTQDKGIMQYKLFLNDLLKLNEMSPQRKNFLKDVYNHIDYEGKGALDVNEMVNLYKRPDPNLPNPVPDLLESFVLFHNIIRGNRNPLVNLDDFIEFYKNINFLIPVTKNDQLFYDYTGDSWCLNDKTFEERKNLAINKLQGLGKQKNRGMMNKLIGSQKTPYGTIKDKINYNLNEVNPTIRYNINKIEDVIQHLRNNLIQRGVRGLMAVRRTFMLIDENSNHKIEYNEFEKLFHKFRFEISDEELKNLFKYFDKDCSGFIDYKEFLNGVTGNLNNLRKNVLKLAFEKLDKSESGKITVGQMRSEYNPKGNPEVRQGKRNEEEILGDFIDLLEYHFNLLNEQNEEGGDINEIAIDFDEFCDFYKNISVCVEDDRYFEIMILGEWDLKKDGKTPYQRTWNKQDA